MTTTNTLPIATTSVSPAATTVVATYATYAEAERAIDELSDRGFAVDRSAIVGRDLRIVERVVGRLTTAGAALMGLGSGAWWGLFVGAIVGFFLPFDQWIALSLVGAAIGAIWGAIFGFVGHLVTSGRRDFDSATTVVAGRYEVTVSKADAQQASELLSPLT